MAGSQTRLSLPATSSHRGGGAPPRDRRLGHRKPTTPGTWEVIFTSKGTSPTTKTKDRPLSAELLRSKQENTSQPQKCRQKNNPPSTMNDPSNMVTQKENDKSPEVKFKVMEG